VVFSSDGRADAWIIEREPGETDKNYAERWDGSAWQLVSLPKLDDNTLLTTISVLGPDDTWIAGKEADGQAFFLHWDGRSWTREAAPQIDHKGASITQMRVFAPNDIWATGNGVDPGSDGWNVSSPLIMHWDGHRWKNTPISAAQPKGVIYDVAADRGHLWAAGDTFSWGLPSYKMAALNWTGSEWTPSPAPVAGQGTLNALASIAGGGLWGVGFVTNTDGGATPVMVRHK
jgi:hypothetical protein